MNEYNIYKYIEFIIFISYLVFIFLSIQIWLLWKDIDKTDLNIRSFVTDFFFKRNFVYVFSFSIFFMIHEFLEAFALPNAMLYFEFFEMLALFSLLLFAYDWYSVLKTCANKRSLPQELIENIKS